MGSRAIVVVCRDADTARDRFGADGGETGAIYTRTGRPFLNTPGDTEAALSRVRGAVESAGLWDELGTGWLVLDCELLPWSAKAMELIRRQYASVGAAARAGLSSTVTALDVAAARGLDVTQLLERQRQRIEHVDHYVEAYRRYVWPVNGPSDLRLAPFHILAAETGVCIDRDHTWHLEHCDRLVAADPDWFQPTGRRAVDVTDAEDQAAGTAWWDELTATGGEGMVVKPMSFIAQGRKGLVQPGIKCRGREYLRIIYGPEYADPGRSIACEPATSGVSARSPSASSDSASRHSNGSFDTSPSTGCTSACSACSRWRASRSIPASDPTAAEHQAVLAGWRGCCD